MQERIFVKKKKNGQLKRKRRIQGENIKNKRPVTSYPLKPPLPKDLKRLIVENMGRFLNISEVKRLKNKEAIKACSVESSIEETEINFKWWDMHKNTMYILMTFWNSIIRNNRLKVENLVQLWSFRVNSTLCFALKQL
ncbi:hypothetical protein PVK06_017209 [Gossypium arboreum]|uniref:Uncharacterized protein n=1 Tax=Gossypium arboreum TaxID=29729 RepID=A0ABR0Q2K9_GOSAR|nr:hypothetical protein PVK06_017209 [Gossypium arboreum]